MTNSSLTAGFQLPPRLVVGEGADSSVARKFASKPCTLPAPLSAAPATNAVQSEPTTHQAGSTNGSPSQSCASKKGQPWSENEHLAFISGLKKLGKGNWRGISRYYVQTRTPTQVASHAQKHFMRLNGVTKRKSRFSVLEQAVVSQGVLSEKPLASQPIASSPVQQTVTQVHTQPAPPAVIAHTPPQWAHPACSFQQPLLQPGHHQLLSTVPVYPAGFFAGQPITFLPAAFALSLDGRVIGGQQAAGVPALPRMAMPASIELPRSNQPAVTLPIQPAVETTRPAPSAPLKLPAPIDFTPVCRPTAHLAGEPKLGDLMSVAKNLGTKSEGSEPWAGKPSLGSAFQLPKATAC